MQGELHPTEISRANGVALNTSGATGRFGRQIRSRCLQLELEGTHTHTLAGLESLMRDDRLLQPSDVHVGWDENLVNDVYDAV